MQLFGCRIVPPAGLTNPVPNLIGQLDILERDGMSPTAHLAVLK